MSVTAAEGFVASGVACGIRRRGRDLAVVRSLAPSIGAAMFTINQVQAAPLVVSRAHLAAAAPQAVVVNSGVANAATGEQGKADARATSEQAAALLGLAPQQVLVLSTGLIGVPLPMDKVTAGLERAAASLGPEGGEDAAEAIMTTDTRTKTSVARRPGFTVGGMAKGSGMIHPRLATMLAVVTTDYPLAGDRAHRVLREAVTSSFNRISVDGETSPNDAVILLANGESTAERDDHAFADALAEVCADLARQIVADGEGASTIVEITVSGAADDDRAAAVASRIATSPLVKTAAFGRDANWGRILVAAGSAPWDGGFVSIDPGRVLLLINDTTVFRRGTPTGVEPEMGDPVLRIDLDLGLGDGACTYLTSDLTYDYVKINAEYRS